MKTIIAVTATVAFFATPFAARAQACVDDTPPANPPVDATCVGLKVVGECPAQDPSLKFSQLTIAYLPDDGRNSIDVGPCGGSDAYCPTECADPRASCQQNTDGEFRCQIALMGDLLVPEIKSKKLLPAVILIPGSTDCENTPGVDESCVTFCEPDADIGLYPPESFCALKTLLLKEGYVVYEVYPRGYSDTGIKSTGVYVGNLAIQQVSRGDACTIGQAMPNETCTIFDLEDEAEQDIVHAVTRLKGISFVDPDKIAVLGHSYGGIRTIALNGIKSGVKAAVGLSPASESWCAGGQTNVPLEAELTADLGTQRAPLMLVSPANDVNLTPLEVFSNELATDRHQSEAVLFPPQKDPQGNVYTFGDIAHYCFVNTKAGVDQYGPAVIDFFKRYGVSK